jgi:type IV secretion system protein VirB4
MQSVLARASRDVLAAERIPYAALVTPTLARCVSGDYVQTLRLRGVSFESADDEAVNAWHARLNVLWRNIGSPQVALWTHVIRRRDTTYPEGVFAPGFAHRLNARYRKRLAGETLMVNELYVSLVYRPTTNAAQRFTLGALSRRNPADEAREWADSIDVCQKLTETVRTALEVYEPEVLGLYRHQGRLCSQLLEFLGVLVNGEWQRMPLPRAPVNEVLATSRAFFGQELIEQRAATEMRWGAMLAIKEYPTPTTPGMFNGLLAAPFAFVLTQSFGFLSKATAQGLLQRQSHRMVNAGDFAVSQTEALRDALDALTSNEFVMGEHHLTLQVQTPWVRPGAGAAEAAIGQLQDDVALARSLLADCGMTVAREDLALEAAFWAQLPGAFSWRPRASVITSRNFAAMAPFHDYPSGRAAGNHWGEALALLATSARSPYYFSLHASDPRDSESGSRRDTGHTLICGPTGSGKTVFIGFLMAMLAKQGVTQVVFDKDHGLEVLVRALGGAYCPLAAGEPTGLNPLQLEPTPEAVSFLKDWLRTLVRPRSGELRDLTSRQEADLEQALRGTLALPVGARRLSRVLEYLDATDPEGLYARLAPWCESADGEWAWVFDQEGDQIVPLMNAHAVIGFDGTRFLDQPALRTPITLYLFHLVRRLLDGRRLVCWLDEFWRLLADPAFAGFAKDGPKTWRKLNGVMCLATQSASDVLESPISRTLIEQTQTKIFFPNSEAQWPESEALGLSEREHRLIKEELTTGSRQFLVKQGTSSVVCGLDLKGFELELAVMSGRADIVRRVQALVAERGEALAAWWPTFEAVYGPKSQTN